MSKTFSFDTQLNNYKSLGLALSGGIDSALLLYYLLNQDYKIKCYTAIDKNNDNNRQAATDIKDLIEKKTGKTVEHFEFIEYEKDHEKGKREKMTESWTNLFNSNTIDCILTGATQYLKSIDDKWNQGDKKKATDTKWMKGSGTYITYRPFLEHDKTWIKQGCDANELTDNLVKISVSCNSTSTPPCKDCLPCAEKYQAFGCY